LIKANIASSEARAAVALQTEHGFSERQASSPQSVFNARSIITSRDANNQTAVGVSLASAGTRLWQVV
jgi:hypothetical protein